jgi:hypothetical protein
MVKSNEPGRLFQGLDPRRLEAVIGNRSDKLVAATQ